MSTSTIGQRSSKRAKRAKLDTIDVIGVARQSRGDDGSKSTEDQGDAMRITCERNGWNLLDVYVEQDVSGQRPLRRRPGLSRAIEDVESGRAQVVLVAYFDRLARSIKTQLEVQERLEAVPGASLQACDVGEISNATAVGWLSAQQLGMMSEFYARQTGEKTAVSKQRNINAGVPPFPRITPAYVKREDGTLEQHPVNGPLVSEACQMRAKGASYSDVQRFLDEQGLRLTKPQIRSMFASKLLIGEIHFGTFEPNLHAIDDPVTDRATWRKCQTVKSTRGRKPVADHLLARQGLLHCKTCGARMSSKPSGSYTYYRCMADFCSARALVSTQVADEFVRDAAIKLSADFKGRASAAKNTEAARVEAKTAQARLNSAIKSFAALMDEPAARETLDELQAERDAAVARHERLLARSTRVTLTSAEAWKVASLAQRRALVHAVIESVVVAPGRGVGRIEIIAR
jgi:DNA invertase Pin-like site-specific DNA recombinase